MVYVKGGTFTMGAEEDDKAFDEAKPAHKVTLSDYWIGETQVTQALWEAVMKENPSRFEKDSTCPVESVNWYKCQVFIERLNDMLRDQIENIGEFCLPTEAQWEYAARGGNLSNQKNSGFPGGNFDLDNAAWYMDNSDGKPHPVAKKDANELGLYDMSGNVWEWCEDRYDRYNSDPQTNPKGAEKGSYRVRRGGGWGATKKYCLVYYRRKDDPSEAYNYGGLRLAIKIAKNEGVSKES